MVRVEYALLFVLFDSVHLVVLAAVRAFSVPGFHLVVVAGVANLVLAIAGVEFLFHLLQLDVADVADVVSALAGLVLLWRVVVLLLRLRPIGLFLLGVLLVLTARTVALVVAGVLFASFVVIAVRVGVVRVVAGVLAELLVLRVLLVAGPARIVIVGVCLIVATAVVLGELRLLVVVVVV